MRKQKVLFDETRDHDPDPDANLESNSLHAPLRTNEVAAFDSPVHIHFHHVRTRLADLDGISVKAVLDGLVEAGIFPDDSPKQIASITHSQSQGNPETTTITIETINKKGRL